MIEITNIMIGFKGISRVNVMFDGQYYSSRFDPDGAMFICEAQYVILGGWSFRV